MLDGRHPTVKAHDSEFVFASLCLARQFLIGHAKTLNVPVLVFESTIDDSWQRYLTAKKV